MPSLLVFVSLILPKQKDTCLVNHPERLLQKCSVCTNTCFVCLHLVFSHTSIRRRCQFPPCLVGKQCFLQILTDPNENFLFAREIHDHAICGGLPCCLCGLFCLLQILAVFSSCFPEGQMIFVRGVLWKSSMDLKKHFFVPTLFAESSFHSSPTLPSTIHVDPALFKSWLSCKAAFQNGYYMLRNLGIARDALFLLAQTAAVCSIFFS